MATGEIIFISMWLGLLALVSFENRRRIKLIERALQEGE